MTEFSKGKGKIQSSKQGHNPNLVIQILNSGI